MNKTLDKLKQLSDYCDASDTEDKNTEFFEESVSIITNELWELGILINNLRLKKHLNELKEEKSKLKRQGE